MKLLRIILTLPLQLTLICMIPFLMVITIYFVFGGKKTKETLSSTINNYVQMHIKGGVSFEMTTEEAEKTYNNLKIRLGK